MSLVITFKLGLIVGGLDILCSPIFCGDWFSWFGNTFYGYYCCGDWFYWFYADPSAVVGAEAGAEVVS